MTATAPYPPHLWKALTKKEIRKLNAAEQLEVAKYAEKRGVSVAADKFQVSIVAVRNACALTGIVPFVHRPRTHKEKVRYAFAALRTLGLTVKDLQEDAT